MKIIQIRGNNGTGKTTIIREYLKKHGYENDTVTVGARSIDVQKTGNVVVIGRYDKNACGGCDASIKNANELKETIAKIARYLRPEYIVFEGVMYGKTVSFTNDVYKYAKAAKAEFVAICLEPAFDTTLERIYRRNGGKDVNVEQLYSGWKGSIKSNAKLRAMKVPMRTYDTGVMTEEEMSALLEREVGEWET